MSLLISPFYANNSFLNTKKYKQIFFDLRIKYYSILKEYISYKLLKIKDVFENIVILLPNKRNLILVFCIKAGKLGVYS